jgi:hypothetical protein
MYLDPFGSINSATSNGNLLDTPGFGGSTGDGSVAMSGGTLGGLGGGGGSSGTLGMGGLNPAGSTAGTLRERRMKSAAGVISFGNGLACSLLLTAFSVFLL